jgi:hypothetical protein
MANFVQVSCSGFLIFNFLCGEGYFVIKVYLHFCNHHSILYCLHSIRPIEQGCGSASKNANADADPGKNLNAAGAGFMPLLSYGKLSNSKRNL